jgi:hypothetical protein
VNSFVIKGDKVHVFLTQGKKTVIDREDLERVLSHQWHAHKRASGIFYAKTNIRRNGKFYSCNLHGFLTGYEETDHIDRDGLNNRRENLRPGKDINGLNRSLSIRNKSGFKGVDQQAKKWRARVTINGKRQYVGLFDNPEKAAHAFDRAARAQTSEKIFLNFP